MKIDEPYPYPECKLCRTVDDCKHADKPEGEFHIPMPPDNCPKPINVMRRTLRKYKRNENRTKN